MMLQGATYGMGGQQLRSRVDALLQAFGLTEPANRSSRPGAAASVEARRRDRTCPRAARPVPRRTDHGPRPRSALRAVGGGPPTECRGLDDPAHDPLPRGGRPAGQPGGDHRPRQDRRGGAPDELKSALNGDSIVLELADTSAAVLNGRLTGALGSIGELSDQSSKAGSSVRASATAPVRCRQFFPRSMRAGISVASVTVARPSLDDVYLKYTGRAYVAQNQEASL